MVVVVRCSSRLMLDQNCEHTEDGDQDGLGKDRNDLVVFGRHGALADTRSFLLPLSHRIFLRIFFDFSFSLT